ncbi:MAG: family 10 glycosylhydrolase [Lachnospiraceae bacterium]
MKQIIRRGMAFFLSFCLLLGCISITTNMGSVSAASTTVNYKYNKKAYQYKGEAITITYDGEKLDMTKIPAFKVGDVVMAAYKKVFKNTIGVTCSYDKKSKVLVLKYNSNTLEMTVGSKKATLNGKAETLKAAPMNITYTSSKENRVVVPVKQVCKLLGVERSWDSKTNVLAISSKKATTVETKETIATTDDDEEFKAMWISYLELESYAKSSDHSEEAFKTFIDHIYDKTVESGMNAVIVHVRPMGDALYPSKYYPWSKYLTGTEGVNPGFNPLKIMVEEAHERGLEFHAWINPYRVSTQDSYDALSSNNPAKKWHNSDNNAEQRNVLSYNGALYYNPAKKEVQDLILNGVKEIVQNYDIDAIHFDDYFYPQFTSENVLTDFDAKEYTGTETVTGIANWRRENVSTLIKNIYSMIDSIDQNVEFGISPAGSIDNLKSEYSYYVDIEKWLSQEGYIDYVIPQIYWGFTHKVAAFDKMVSEWSTLNKNNIVKLYIGIGTYRVGQTDSNHTNQSEWMDSSLMKKQISNARQNSRVKGFAFFSYAYFDLRSTYNFAQTSGISSSRYSSIEKAVNELIPMLKSK